jgi:hypothetical protein
VNNSHESAWLDVFSVLLREAESKVGGREGPPEELRRELQRLSVGDLRSPEKAAELSKLCEKIADSPEALALLARLLETSPPAAGD